MFLPANVKTRNMWIYLTLIWICAQCTQGEEEIRCLSPSTPTTLKLFCPNTHFIHVRSVLLGKTPSLDGAGTFCSFPTRQAAHCQHAAPEATAALVRGCGTFATCSRTLGDGGDGEGAGEQVPRPTRCGAEFQGDEYIAVLYDCIQRTTDAGETLEFVDIGTSHSVTHPHSTVFLISQDYSSLSSLPRSVCRLRSTTTAARFSIQVLDFHSMPAQCSYSLLLIDALSSPALTSASYCQHNLTASITLDGGGGGGGAGGMIQIAFLQGSANAEGRVWLKVEVLNADGSPSTGGIGVDCSPTMNLLTMVTTPSAPTTTTTTTTTSTTTTPAPATTTEDITTTTSGNVNETSPTTATPEATTNGDNDAKELNMFWVYVGIGIGGCLLLLIIIIVCTALCYKRRGDNNQPTIKASDLIDAWDDSSTLGHTARKKHAEKSVTANPTPPNMCANVYADIPAHRPPPPPRRPSETTLGSVHSVSSSDRLWNVRSGTNGRANGTVNGTANGVANGTAKRGGAMDGFINGGYDARSDYSRQASRENKYVKQNSKDVGYSRQNSKDLNVGYSRQNSKDLNVGYSRQNSKDLGYAGSDLGYSHNRDNFSDTGMFTLPHNFSRQTSQESHLSNHFNGGLPDNGFRTLPHPPSHRRTEARTEARTEVRSGTGARNGAKVPPPTYAKPRVPKRTTSLDHLEAAGNGHDREEDTSVYERPMKKENLHGSQASLYGYSTTLPE